MKEKKQKQKKEKALTPIIEERNKSNLSPEQRQRLMQIAEQLNKIKSEYTGDSGDINSYFTNVLDKLMSKDDISLKTEYINVNENFAGVVLDFLGEYANMPYLNRFVELWEMKRVSLGRKSRKEMVMTLEKRETEVQAYNQRMISQTLGYQ